MYAVNCCVGTDMTACRYRMSDVRTAVSQSVLVCVCVCHSVKEVVCFGEGAGANILARFAVSLSTFCSSLHVFCTNCAHC